MPTPGRFVRRRAPIGPVLAGSSRHLAAVLGVFAAGVLVVSYADRRHRGRGAARLRASRYDPHMPRLQVFAARLRAVVHQHTRAGAAAAQAPFDAGLHLGGLVSHPRLNPSTRDGRRRRGARTPRRPVLAGPPVGGTRPVAMGCGGSRGEMGRLHRVVLAVSLGSPALSVLFAGAREAQHIGLVT